jgi:hypothetical protein
MAKFSMLPPPCRSTKPKREKEDTTTPSLTKPKGEKENQEERGTLKQQKAL